MRTRTLTTLSVTTLLAVLVCGCAGLGGGPSDEELITQVMVDWTAAAQAEDLDKLMAVYSEDYSGEEGEDKAAVEDFMQGVIDQGYFDELDVDLQYAEMEIEGDTATMAPVDLSSSAGSISMSFDVKKEADGVWRIVSAGEY